MKGSRGLFRLGALTLLALTLMVVMALPSSAANVCSSSQMLDEVEIVNVAAKASPAVWSAQDLVNFDHDGDIENGLLEVSFKDIATDFDFDGYVIEAVPGDDDPGDSDNKGVADYKSPALVARPAVVGATITEVLNLEPGTKYYVTVYAVNHNTVQISPDQRAQDSSSATTLLSAPFLGALHFVEGGGVLRVAMDLNGNGNSNDDGEAVRSNCILATDANCVEGGVLGAATDLNGNGNSNDDGEAVRSNCILTTDTNCVEGGVLGVATDLNGNGNPNDDGEAVRSNCILATDANCVEGGVLGAATDLNGNGNSNDDGEAVRSNCLATDANCVVVGWDSVGLADNDYKGTHFALYGAEGEAKQHYFHWLNPGDYGPFDHILDKSQDMKQADMLSLDKDGNVEAHCADADINGDCGHTHYQFKAVDDNGNTVASELTETMGELTAASADYFRTVFTAESGDLTLSVSLGRMVGGKYKAMSDTASVMFAAPDDLRALDQTYDEYLKVNSDIHGDYDENDDLERWLGEDKTGADRSLWNPDPEQAFSVIKNDQKKVMTAHLNNQLK